MKKLLMFTMEGCPHCRKAREYMDELYESNPEYKELDIEIIDELLQPETAEKYDYYYVPTYYLDGEKFHEGVPSREMVEDLFKKAYES
ncbi:MAG TPA: thioredoxin family protein [Bacillota bacterium]|nr:thioredoxin family protein [Bacillota bacterium]